MKVSWTLCITFLPWACSTVLPKFQERGIETQATLRPGFPHPNPTISYWQDPPHRIADHRTTTKLPRDKTFDYIIVGSGVAGSSVARKLLDENPKLSILMLEARRAASGASGRNGGHCRPGMWKSVRDWIETYGEDEGLKLAKMEQESVLGMREFVLSNKIPSGWQDVETADLYWTKEAFEKAVEVFDFQKELNDRRPDDVAKNNRTVYAGQDARDHWGWPEILGAITFRSHTQNPYLTVCAMLEHSLRKGLNLQTNTVALSLKQLSKEGKGGAKWELKTNRGTVRGKKVVLATNGFTSAIHPGFASTGFLTPTRLQATAVRPGKDTSDNPVFRRSASYPDLHSGSNYIVVRAPGTIGEGDVIYGGGKQFSPTREMNITDDSVVNPDIATHLNGVGRVVYGHENWGETTKQLRDWTGIACDTPDGLPLVGGVPGEDGLWALVCFNGHGMAWADKSADALVHMMIKGQAPKWFPKAFRSERAWE